LRTCPIAPKNANGRDNYTDALYDQSARNGDLYHRGVLYIRCVCGNLDGYDTPFPSPCDVYGLPASYLRDICVVFVPFPLNASSFSFGVPAFSSYLPVSVPFFSSELHMPYYLEDLRTQPKKGMPLGRRLK
jgi:hypothetical protein